MWRIKEYRIIKRLGGLTNTNLLVENSNRYYVYRKAGKNTSIFLNRKEECFNTKIVVREGLSPKQVNFHEETGDKITEYIENAITLNQKTIRNTLYLESVVTVLNELHNLNGTFANNFELEKLMVHYEMLCRKEFVKFPSNFEQIKKRVLDLLIEFQKMNIKFKPCHIDPLCENFLWDPKDGKMYIIDFEYSGMFDPIWDIAAIGLEGDFSEIELKEFTKKYFNISNITAEIERRLFFHSVFQDYLWFLWAAFKNAWGEDFEEYRDYRWQRLCNKF